MLLEKAVVWVVCEGVAGMCERHAYLMVKKSMNCIECMVGERLGKPFGVPEL